jgi:hypothetical protein
MDYSQYKVLEFRRKFFRMFGAAISIFEPTSNSLVGYIKMRAWTLRGDIRVYSDKSQQQELVAIGGRQIISLKPTYKVSDSQTGTTLAILRFQGLKTYFVRGHVDILDQDEAAIGYVQETSSQLAILRRYLLFVPYIGIFLELIFAFVPQTFDIIKYAADGVTPQLAGKIVHRKNPIIVKMSLDTNEAEASFDPRVNIGVCSILSILDANKDS